MNARCAGFSERRYLFGPISPMGTWKLNEAKSKFVAGATKNNTVVYEAAGNMTKITVDGVDRQRRCGV